jgi:sugar lactone lactonase YvrE
VPQLRRLRQRFPTGLVVIGVHSAKFPAEHETANIRQAVMRHEIEHPVVNDADMRIWSDYNVRAWPTLIVVDPRGRIAGEISGEILADDLAPTIEELLGEHAGSLDPTPIDLLPEALAASTFPRSALRFPSKVLVSPDGAPDRLFIADTGHHRIVEVRLDAGGLSGEAVRIFGRGQPGFQDGPPEQAAFHAPHGMALQPELGRGGQLFVADTENHAVRAIDLASGEVTTAAGTGEKAHGAFALGAPTQTPLRSPWAVLAISQYVFIALAGSHQIWILIGSDGTHENNEQLAEIGPFAGNGREALVDGEVAEASFNQPSDLAFALNHILVADAEASAVRAVSLGSSPRTLTLVGQGLFEFGDRDGTGAEVRLQHPTGIAFHEETAYIADTYNNKIKTLDPTTGAVQTLIGTGEPGHLDGPFEQARLAEPEGLQVGAFGAGRFLYIADTNNHAIRVADLVTRQVHTLALRAPYGAQLEPPAEFLSEDQLPFRLPPVHAASGPVEVVLDLHLPPGTKLNPEAPTRLRLDGQKNGQALTFAAGEKIAFRVEVGEAQEVELDLHLVYCQAEDSRLCFFHNRRLILPLEPVENGPATVEIPYAVPAVAF